MRTAGEDTRGDLLSWGPTNREEEWIYCMEKKELEWGKMLDMLNDYERNPRDVSKTDESGYSTLHPLCEEVHHAQPNRSKRRKSLVMQMDSNTGHGILCWRSK